jgi:hypothetical protein
VVDKTLPKPWPEAHGFNPRDRDLVELLWDNARTARLSELDYGERLDRLSRWNIIFELLVAIGASGSGIAGWAVWQDKIGAVVWASIAGLAAVIAIAKPLLALDRRIRHATRQQQLYRGILSSLENLAFDIQQAGTLSAENRRRYQRARENLRQAEDADDPAQNLRQLEQLQKRVDKEMPAHSLWVPLPAPEPHPA